MTNQLATMRYLLIPRIIELAAAITSANAEQLLSEFYSSHVNSLLQDENTGMWHLSAQALAALFVEERATGAFPIPHEV